MKLLICGDSFAADWTVKYNDIGWPNMLANDYKITNLAQAGCSEYKIYKQLISVDINDYDRIIVSHTSPYRIYTTNHPVHANDKLHKNSDLIYTDLKEHSKTNKKLLPLIDFFENYFDTESAIFTHTLICEKINELLKNHPQVLHISNLNWNGLYCFPNLLHFEYLFKEHRGLMNHYTLQGNEIIYKKIKTILDSKT
jgi:hypothetical protein